MEREKEKAASKERNRYGSAWPDVNGVIMGLQAKGWPGSCASSLRIKIYRIQ